jgi:hypothetical protein
MRHSSGTFSVDETDRSAIEGAYLGNPSENRAQRNTPRSSRDKSIDNIIGAAVSKVMASIIPAIQRQIASMVTGEIEKGLAVRNGIKPSRALSRRTRSFRPHGEEITKWVADKWARRVPNFVIELTGGLDTKKKIRSSSDTGIGHSAAGTDGYGCGSFRTTSFLRDSGALRGVKR